MIACNVSFVELRNAHIGQTIDSGNDGACARSNYSHTKYTVASRVARHNTVGTQTIAVDGDEIDAISRSPICAVGRNRLVERIGVGVYCCSRAAIDNQIATFAER